MIERRIYHPAAEYGSLLVANVLLIFLVFLAPWALLALVPEIGPGFLPWYLGANALWIAIALVLIPRYVRSVSYELGEHELIVKRGIITRSIDLVPYHMITNVALRRGPIARALGMGTLKIHTAGYSQSSTAEATIAGIANYEELREAIIAAMRAAERPSTAPTTSQEGLLQALLAEVRGLRADLKH